MVAAFGATPCPHITSGRELLASYKMIGTSPPGPFRCGSTICRVNAVATAASKALPPRSKMPIPTAVAIQWVEVTTPKVPSISGRVVNGLGLILVIGGHLFYAVTAMQTRSPPSAFWGKGGDRGCRAGMTHTSTMELQRSCEWRAPNHTREAPPTDIFSRPVPLYAQ